MRFEKLRWALLATIFPLSIGRPAGAQEEPPAPVVHPPQALPPPTDADRRVQELEKKMAALREELDQLKEDHAFTAKRVDEVMPVKNKITGYLDFGFFAVQGNGSGIRPDTGYQHFPEYNGVVPDSWVFMGDPLATAINSRGEPADLGGSRAVTFDPVRNAGKPSFIVNSLTLALFHGIGDNLTVNGNIDFVPRSRNVSDPTGVALGDFIDVRLAYAEYMVPVKTFSLSLYAGKFDSVLGVEYKNQEAPDRISVTPSLICRYTCGHPLGLKARARFFDERLVLNAAVTNGSHSAEYFPFYDEIDTNVFKTLAGRISYKFPVGTGLEFGASGAFGAQDNQTSEKVYQWHYGFDVSLEWKDWILRGEYVKGHAEGKTDDGQPPCNAAPCLRYQGAYGQLAYRLLNWLTPYFRADWRDALHQNGATFVYISDLVRFTGGARFDLGTNVIVKGEYTAIRELGRTPQFGNNVLTTSMIVKF